MIDLQKHEQFEIEVLKLLSDHQLLNPLIFGGGTCLRLCFGLNRYSVDLDFWILKEEDVNFFTKLKTVLSGKYKITDHHEKHFSFLSEISSPLYPRKLKIEIRKQKDVQEETDLSIAFSPYANQQVRLTTFTPQQMWKNKVSAFLDRAAIRDAYDLEFLFKKGYANMSSLSDDERKSMIETLDKFSTMDFTVRLGSLLEPDEREYYGKNGFKILRNALR